MRLATEGAIGLRSFGRDFRALSSQMPVARSHAVIDCDFISASGRFRPCAEIELHRFPRVAALRVQTKTRSRLVPAMRHTVFAARISRDAIHDAVLVPVNVREQLGV